MLDDGLNLILVYVSAVRWYVVVTHPSIDPEVYLKDCLVKVVSKSDIIEYDTGEVYPEIYICIWNK